MISPTTAGSAGGSATSGGVEFQARVAAWIAVLILARDQASPPWGLPENCRLEAIWAETGLPVDDLLVGTSAGGFVYLQVKRRLDLGSGSRSEFASAVDQVVRQFLRRRDENADKPWNRPLSPERDRLVLTTGAESSEPFRIYLPKVLERLAAGGIAATFSKAEEAAYSAFMAAVMASWQGSRAPLPTEIAIASLAKLCRIQVLDLPAGGQAEIEAKDRLRRLLSQPEQAGAAWAVLLAEAMRLTSQRSGVDRPSLRRLMNKNGIKLQGCSSGRRLFSYRQLQEIVTETLPLQIERLSQNKYVPGLFVRREGLEQLDGLLDAAVYFRPKAIRLIDRLQAVANKLQAGAFFSDPIFVGEVTPEGVADAIPELKRIFHYDTVESAIGLGIAASRRERDADFEQDCLQLARYFESMSFLEAGRLKMALRDLYFTRQRYLSAGSSDLDDFWLALPGESPNPEGLANALIVKLDELARRCAKHSFAVVGRAGHGKTNLICSLAEELGREFPLFLFDGQMTVSSEYEIEDHIERCLERGLGQSCSGWLGAIGEILEEESSYLFVLIDAVNENADPNRMSRALESFASRCLGRRIKIVFSCRDFFWPIFERKLQPLLYGAGPLLLDEFTEPEWKKATALYFEKFRVQCHLGSEAEATLRNPLLLRLFCHANHGRDLGEVRDLRILDIYSGFVDSSISNIVGRAGLANGALIESLLNLTGEVMWRGRTSTLRPGEIGISPQDQSDPHSIFNQVRSEGLLVDSLPDQTGNRALDRPVRFAYEAISEYVIASAWRQQQRDHNWIAGDLSPLLDDAIAAIPVFPPALGAILLFARMSLSPEGLLREILERMAARGDHFFVAQQAGFLAAFESLPASAADDVTIGILARFEALCSPDTKNALAPIILRYLHFHRDNPLIRTLALRLLEVDPGMLASTPAASKNAVASQRRADSESRSDDEGAPILPPARYHYPQETRLTALSILVSSELDAGLLVEGARKLANHGLHHALNAFRSLDCAADSLVYSIAEDQLGASSQEYRLYVAWLLRARYGARPAKVLFKLLLDPQTRVHRYAHRLFKVRRVEAELLETILNHLERGATTPSWHLAPLLDLVSAIEGFRVEVIFREYAARIIAVLRRATLDPSPIVRKAAYQGLLSCSPPENRREIVLVLSGDASPMVRALQPSND